MAEPQTNGHSNGQPERFIDSINPDDPEREKELMKSVEVREDLKGMAARKRVSEILNSQAFRDELEEIIESQPDDSPVVAACQSLKTGPHPASLLALHQISQLILPGSSAATGALAGARSGSVIPIADVKGINASVYSKGERLLRCKLASVYRLMDLQGWVNSGIYNHITVRVSQDKEHFLINPLGLLYNEVTAGSLLKVDMQGSIVDRGNTNLGLNQAGFFLHAAIHAARPDLKCIIHIHTTPVIAVSALKCGLLPLSQDAIYLGPVSYHEFEGVLAVDDAEKELLARNIGPNNKIMFLRNRGVLVCGSTIEEAFHLSETLVDACLNQMSMMPLGLDNLSIPSEEAQKRTRESQATQSWHIGTAKKWKVGELEFESRMRALDTAGYRTGYVYRQPALKCERTDRQTSDVEYPASTSVLAFYDGAGEFTSPVKEAQERNKRLQKTDWLNTPNVYKREDVDEIGTDNPKKITKWVREHSPEKTNAGVEIKSKNQFAPLGGERREMKNKYKEWVPDKDSNNRQGTPVKVVNPNQFAPQGENPKEFLQQQRQIKDGYYTDKISAGPQSKVLDGGMTEGQIMDANQSATGDHVMIVGAASKGIIKREHQHNAVVYKSYYTTNPFDKMTDDELASYQEAVKKGEKPPQEEVLQALAEEEAQRQTTNEQVDAPVEPVVAEPESMQEIRYGSERYLKTQSTPALNKASPDQSAPFHQQTPPAHSAYTPTKSPSSQKRSYYTPRTTAMRRAKSKETNIDDVLDDRPSARPQETPQPAIRRGADQYSSMRAPAKSAQQEIKSKSSFQRSKSERKPKKGDKERPASTEVAQNGEGDINDNGPESPTKDGKKKKDKKSRMPSFSFGKKKDAKKSKSQTAV